MLERDTCGGGESTSRRLSFSPHALEKHLKPSRGGGKTLKCCLEVDYVARNESDILIRNTNLHLFFLVFMGQIKWRTTKKSIKSVSRNKSGLFQSR